MARRDDLMYIDYVKSYVERSIGGRVENVLFHDGKADIIAVSPTGEKIVIKYIGARIPLSAIDAEITHEAHESESLDASYVYLAVPGRKLVHANRRTIQIVSEKNVGVLEVRDNGEVIEIRVPRQRRSTRVQTDKIIRATQGLKIQSALQEAPVPLEGSVKLKPVPAQPLRPEIQPATGTQPSGSSGDLPDFIKDNPWLQVLGSKKPVGGG
ncbi:hypothetical protein IG193_04755 [Infirmifilum lucidum]|uniref:Uncharacterized protein n=1 Tax=Infirmifilum lucidum TaxID=2776706 RepID=A0A7L9FFE9_9CREN|nr:hypothetical protein [Infirmifilum lucidum]QOJ78102.1 hypothetical protein IG193_04755 [Infirmifilum lucidum]